MYTALVERLSSTTITPKSSGCSNLSKSLFKIKAFVYKNLDHVRKLYSATAVLMNCNELKGENHSKIKCSQDLLLPSMRF